MYTADAPVRHESEAIERAALEALHAAADPALAAGLGLAFRPLGDGVASVAARLPASAIVVNRVVGLGLERPLAPATIVEAAALYRGAGIARFFLNLHPDAASPHVTEACRAAGLVPARGWQKFVRDRGAPLPATADVEIREATSADGPAFARIACAAFDLGAAAEPWLARLPGRPGYHVFLAFVDGEPAGCGALVLDGDLAWTDWGATAPAFRGRGIQRALLAHRCRTADARGVRRTHTCTGEAVPGEPQHSFGNILRCGFRETYVRPNWAPPKP
jgi:GNAT superfamily N-acetyltransferase